MRNVALCYVRKSMVRTATDAVSPERQRANCQAEAARRGYVAEFYEDAEGHRSGRSEKGRPGWLALKDQLARGDVAAVIVESLSRASRSVKDLATLLDELQKREIALISLKENIDTSSAMGRAFIGFIAVLNQFESDIASERMKMTIAFKRESKGQHFGYTPFGCARAVSDSGALRPSREGVWRMGDACVVGLRDEPPFADAERAAQAWRGYHDALARCYEWYAEGDAGNRILRDRLNAAGYCYRDRHGIPRAFTEDDVRRMLAAHRVYAGFILNGRAKMGASVLREANFAPILPRDLCDRVQAMLATRRKYGAQFIAHRKGRLYLLGGLLYCGVCGQKMGGMFQDGKAFYRHQRAKRCGACGQVLAETLDAQVLTYLQRFTVPAELKAQIITLARQMIQEQARPEHRAARATLAKLARKLENLKEMRIEGEIDRAEYARRKAEIEAQIRDVQAHLGDAPPDAARLEQLLPKIDQIAEIIREGSAQHQKELYRTLFERIEQVDGRITRIVAREWARPLFNR
jgi:DNA invertase Pin-like site-specific DNA recombinase